jgi:hypothetical protein
MDAEKFIDGKSTSLSHYLNLFLLQEINYRQLSQFLWETLQEWQQLAINDETIASCKEEVFWHLFFELDHPSSQQLPGNLSKIQLLSRSALFLQGQGLKPYGCIGIRPVMPAYLQALQT